MNVKIPSKRGRISTTPVITPTAVNFHGLCNYPWLLVTGCSFSILVGSVYYRIIKGLKDYLNILTYRDAYLPHK